MKPISFFILLNYAAIAGNVLFVLWILTPTGLRLLRDPQMHNRKVLSKRTSSRAFGGGWVGVGPPAGAEYRIAVTERISGVAPTGLRLLRDPPNSTTEYLGY